MLVQTNYKTAHHGPNIVNYRELRKSATGKREWVSAQRNFLPEYKARTKEYISSDSRCIDVHTRRDNKTTHPNLNLFPAEANRQLL